VIQEAHVHIIKTFPNCYCMRPFVTSRVRSRSVIVETALEFVMWDYTSCTFILLALHYIRRPRAFFDITAFTLYAACCDVVPFCTPPYASLCSRIVMFELFVLDTVPVSKFDGEDSSVLGFVGLRVLHYLCPGPSL
jgi:hypothetical protein